MLSKGKKVTKQIGELTILRRDAGLLDSGLLDVCLGAACSYSAKSELETMYRYEDISNIWSNVLCVFTASQFM